MADQTETVPAPLMGRLLSKLLGDPSLATVQKPAAKAPSKPVPRYVQPQMGAPRDRPAGAGDRRDKNLEDALRASGV